MIVLDTNVVSEFMGTPPTPTVQAWLNRQDPVTLHVTTVTIAEIRFGLRLMAAGKRQKLLSEQFERFLAIAFESRVLVFDESAAGAYAEIRGHRFNIGRPMTPFDAQIAAIARCNALAVATRNLKYFENCGVDLINPFDFDLES